MQEHTKEAEGDAILVNNKRKEWMRNAIILRLYNDLCFYGDSTGLPASQIAFSPLCKKKREAIP